MLEKSLKKLIQGELLSGEEVAYLEAIDRVQQLVSSWVVPGSTIPLIRNLRAENIIINSGEIQLGEGIVGENFSGVRIGYPAFEYDGESWNIAGVHEDVMQVGIRASDGKFIAAGGSVIIDESGISIIESPGGQAYLSFYNESLEQSVDLKFADNSLQVQNLKVGGEIGFYLKLTNNDAPALIFEEDAAQTNRTLVQIFDGIQGARLVLGAGGGVDFRTQGASGGSTFMRMLETSNTPPSGSNDAFHMYMKGDKLIIQFDDSGTVRYKYLDLTGTGATWTHTTTAP